MGSAVQDYELLLRVRADLMEAVKGMEGLSASIGGAKDAADAVGESADQASGRIKKMVQATSEQVQIQESARSQAERAAQTANATIRSYDDQAAAIKRAADAAASYRERSAPLAGSGAAAAALETERAAMAKLAGQIDPTVAALAKLDAQEKSLNAMRKAGIVGLDDYSRFKTLIDDNRAAITKTSTAMHGLSLNTAQTRLEFGRLLKDIGTGQWGRLASTGTTLANQAGFISLLFSPLGATIGAVVGSLGAFVVAAEQVSAENDKVNQSIQQTGNYAGVTVGEVAKLADGLANSKVSAGAARDVLNQLVASGKVGSQALGALGQAAVDMAALTGQSAEKAAVEVLKMFDGTAASALKANEQYHFLTTSVYERIKALEDEGDTQAAMDVAAEAFHRAAQERIVQMNQSLSGLAKWWDSVKSSANGAWERMKLASSVVLGTADNQTQLYNLLGKKATAQEGGLSGTGSVLNAFLGYDIVKKIPGASATWSADDEAKLQELQAKIAAEQQKAADDSTRLQINDGAVKADAGLDRLAASIDKAYGKKEKLKELDKYFNDLWAGADPNNAKLQGVQRMVNADGSVSFSGGLYDTLLADINKKFDPKAPKAKSDAGAVSAQQELIKLLGDEQGALDPVVKIWATYNDHVAKANELADKAKTAKGADVAAIDAQRDALIALYGTTRDAALEKQANKDREAFEKLRDSLKDASGVSFGKMIEELKQLRSMLDKGTINPQEYQDSTQKVLAQNIPKLPEFKGADAIVTGPFGELDKLDSQEKKLQEAYDRQLAALNQWHEQTLNSDQQFVDKENELYQQHATELQKIEDARQRVMMAGLTSSFSGAAEAIKQAYGEQSNAYRAAFSLSKAAAIAQATVNMYMDISQASAKGWPVNIPLIAQALGEGLSIIGNIRSITAGFSEGGYTGPGGKYEYAGPAHKGEVIWSQADVARAGGWQVVDSMRRKGGFADGGYTGPSTAGFATNFDVPMPNLKDFSPARGAGDGTRETHIHVWSIEEAAEKLAASPSMQKAVVHIVGENPRTIQGKWGR